MAHDLGDERIKQHHQADQKNHHAGGKHQADGLDRKRSDAVCGKCDHLFERIFALPRKALRALVGDGRPPVSDLGHNAPQKKIHFRKLCQALHGTAAHQPVIGMIEDDIHPQRLHDLVKSLGRKALEEGIRIPLAAHAVNDVVSLVIGIHHRINGVDIILQVRIHGDHHIRVADCGEHPRQQSILMPPVS